MSSQHNKELSLHFSECKSKKDKSCFIVKKKEIGIDKLCSYLKSNGNLEKLGTNSDNKKEPIHRWFSFLPGFSHTFVKTTVQFLNNVNSNEFCVFDPFMGSATTAVAGKELGVKVFGNESNPFLYEIGKAKISELKDPKVLVEFKKTILSKVRSGWRKTDISKESQLLKKCYSTINLKKLVSFRKLYSSDFVGDDLKPFFFIIISALLPKCSRVGISVPYISWNCTRKAEDPLESFENLISEMESDLSNRRNDEGSSKIYLHDSRKKNKKIRDNFFDLVFTSPPYLNNFDYGEALKVHTYFWNITKNWNEITEKIRKKSLTAATTHYRESDFNFDEPNRILDKELVSRSPKISRKIVKKIKLIRCAKKEKKREKSFDILTALYFSDMFKVLKEIYRTTKDNGVCCLVIGDSAPYGVYIPTDKILGEMGKDLGFSEVRLEVLRSRGSKWLTLKHRHKIKLRESLVILRK